MQCRIVLKLGKKVAYVYKKEKTEQGAIEYLQFSNPLQNYKYRNSISSAIKKAFEEFPPKNLTMKISTLLVTTIIRFKSLTATQAQTTNS